MKVLFFTYDFPYPANSGGKVRAYNLLKHKDKEIEIILFSFVREGFKKEYIDHIKSLGIQRIYLFPRRKVKDIKNIFALFHQKHSIFYYLYFSEEVKKSLHKIIQEEEIDIVHFESFYTGYYIGSKLKETKQIFGSENIESIVYQDYISYAVNTLLKPFYKHQLKKIRQEEEQMFRSADVSLAVTEDEAGYISEISKKKRFVIENGVDLQKFQFHKKEETKIKKLLFVGNFSYFPNKDAVHFLIDNVIKKINNQNILFTIIGKGATRLSLGQQNVRLVEFVEDITEEYKKADIFLSPIRIGGGTNFKILEAMATGIPVLAFPERAASLGIVNTKHALLADSSEFYDALIKLIEDEKLRVLLAKHARELIEEKYSWDVIGRKMNNVWRGI